MVEPFSLFRELTVKFVGVRMRKSVLGFPTTFDTNKRRLLEVQIRKQLSKYESKPNIIRFLGVFSLISKDKK